MSVSYSRKATWVLFATTALRVEEEHSHSWNTTEHHGTHHLALHKPDVIKNLVCFILTAYTLSQMENLQLPDFGMMNKARLMQGQGLWQGVHIWKTMKKITNIVLIPKENWILRFVLLYWNYLIKLKENIENCSSSLSAYVYQ